MGLVRAMSSSSVEFFRQSSQSAALTLKRATPFFVAVGHMATSRSAFG
jgi:hypothetical protein